MILDDTSAVASNIALVTANDIDGDIEAQRSPPRLTRVRKACVCCSKLHMSCDEARPCWRCVCRGIPEQCIDKPSDKKRGRKPQEHTKRKRRARKPSGSSSVEQPKKAISKPEPTPVATRSASKKIEAASRTSIDSPIMTPKPTVAMPPQLLGNVPAVTNCAPLGSPDSSPQLPGQHEDSPLPFLTFDGSDHCGLTEFDVQSELQGSFFTLPPQSPAPPLNYVNVVLPQANVDPNEQQRQSLMRVRSKLMTAYTENETNELMDTMTRVVELHKYVMFQMYPVLMANNFEPLKFWQGFYQQEEIYAAVSRYITGFKGFNETPTIVFDRSGIVYHVSDSYKRLTYWNLPLPTVPPGISDFDELNASGYKEWVTRVSNCIVQASQANRQSWFMFNTGIRNHADGSFLDGTISVNITWDSFNLPLLYVAHFLPSKVPNAKLHYLM